MNEASTDLLQAVCTLISGKFAGTGSAREGRGVSVCHDGMAPSSQDCGSHWLLQARSTEELCETVTVTQGP